VAPGIYAAERRKRSVSVVAVGFGRAHSPCTKSQEPPTDTARLLDNFEQRFAELKGRKASATVLGDLYELGTQLEKRARYTQATAVYRHLARIDNTYCDVAARLRGLMDAERTKPKAPVPAGAGAKTAATAGAAATRAASTRAASTRCRIGEPRPVSASSAAVSAGAQAARTPALAEETQRLGRYQLEREIGRGGPWASSTWAAIQPFNRLVAIKAIPLAAEFSDAETRRSENALLS